MRFHWFVYNFFPFFYLVITLKRSVSMVQNNLRCHIIPTIVMVILKKKLINYGLQFQNIIIMYNNKLI